MTKVTFRRTSRRNRLKILGHATGSETLCAAVSAISGALLGYLANHPEDSGSLVREATVIVSAGRSPEADAVFDATMIGLMQLAEGDPERLTVDQTTWRIRERDSA